MSRMTRSTLATLLGPGLIAGAVWITGCERPEEDDRSTRSSADTSRVAAAASGTIDPSFDRPVVDRDAIDALERMGKYLRSLKSFQVKSEITREDVLPDGQKVQRSGSADVIARRPDRLRAELTNEQRHRFLFYDGKTFTLWADVPNYYATGPAPSTIAEFVDTLRGRYGIEVPLEDLFHWGASGARTADITSARVIGPSRVDGVATDQYAFRQDGLDWQVWIQQGEFPLPRKIVLTTLTDEARPQHTSRLIWNLAPAFSDATFEFTPSRGAQRIVIAEIGTERK